ncbi:unnamed protein product [Echinostoma caproni]|uniref:UBA domain-containing protein n=1 Tax=Echinostoma caproni TaxID=27848 RepID=A0A3P8I9G4_9TREM|nr:unnamed protein product [Echinostoma caproni]
MQAEKSQAFDEALAKLSSLGYPVPLVASTLKICKGDYQAALDRLLATSTSGLTINGPGAVPSTPVRGVSSAGPRSNRGSRRGGGGGRRGRGGYDPNEEDDPRFDPAAAAAAAGLPSRPSTGLTALEDLMPTVNRSSAVGVPMQSGPSGSTVQKRVQLPVGCPILAQNMTGDYEEAVMLGQLTFPGTGAGGGDKVVLVVYTRHLDDGRREEEEELVPLSLIRTLNKERITLDMVPHAPAERARVYNINSTGPSSATHTPFGDGDVESAHGFGGHRGYRGRGRSGYRGSRSRGGSSGSGGGRGRGPGPRRGFRGTPRG